VIQVPGNEPPREQIYDAPEIRPLGGGNVGEEDQDDEPDRRCRPGRVARERKRSTGTMGIANGVKIRTMNGGSPISQASVSP